MPVPTRIEKEPWVCALQRAASLAVQFNGYAGKLRFICQKISMSNRYHLPSSNEAQRKKQTMAARVPSTQ